MNKENLKSFLKTIFKAYYKERETLCYDIERNRNIFTKGIICLISPTKSAYFWSFLIATTVCTNTVLYMKL